MTEVVTRLIVTADGAIRSLDQYEQGMEEAGQATEYTTGAVSDFNRRMETARAAIRQGNALATETVARKTKEQRAWDGLRGSVDRTSKLQIRLEREAARAAVSAANLVNQGNLSEQEALQTLTQLEQRHTAQLSKVVSASGVAAGATHSLAAANDELAIAQQRVQARSRVLFPQLIQSGQALASIPTMGVYAFQNLGYQIADVSQLYYGQGGLKAAFTDSVAMIGKFISKLGPLPLAIAAIGAAAGVWWLMRDKIKSADEALKDHEAILTRIGQLYDSTGKKAIQFSKDNRSLINADLNTDLRGLQATLRKEQNKVLDTLGVQTHFLALPNPYQVKDQYREFSNVILQLQKDVASGNVDWGKFQDQIDQVAKNGPAAMQKTADEIVQATKEVYGLSQALNEVNIVFAKVATGWNRGVEIALKSKLEGQRSAKAHELDLKAIYAKGPAQQAEIARRREALQLQDEQISTALKRQKIEEAGDLAYKQAAFAISEADRQRLRAANDNVDALQVQFSLIGKSKSETERLQFVQQNLATAEAEAAQNGVRVTKAYRAEIERLGNAYGDLQQKIVIGNLSSDIAFARQQIGKTPADQQIAETLRPIFGADQSSAQAQFLAQQLRVNDALKQFDDIGRNATQGFLSTFKSDLKDGVGLLGSFSDALSNVFDKISDQFLSMAGNGIWSAISGGLGFGAPTGGNLKLGYNLGGPASGGLLGGAIIPGILHNGGIAGQDGYGHSRAFPAATWTGAERFHQGSMGVGLKPNEIPAILQRGEKVIPANRNNPQAANSNGDVYISVDARGAQQGVGAEIARALRDFSYNELPDRVQDIQSDPYGRGPK